MDFIFSVQSYCKKVVKRKLVAGYDLERTLSQLFLHIHIYICIYWLIQELTESLHQSNKIKFLQPWTLYYIFITNVCFYLSLLSGTCLTLNIFKIILTKPSQTERLIY